MIKVLTIIGIVLGVLILLLLLLILAILFVPIRYKIYGSNRETLYASFTISYFLSFIRLKVYYRDKMGYGALRLFGIKIFDNTFPEIIEFIEKVSDFLDKLNKKDKDKEEKPEETAPESGEDEEEYFISEEEAEEYLNGHDELDDMNELEKSVSFVKWLKDCILNIKKKWYNFKKFINEKLKQWEKLKKEIKFYYKILQCPSLKPTLILFKDVMLKILKHVFPRKAKANVDYGSEDGYTMAKYSGYLCMAQGYFGKAFVFNPHWGENILKLDGYIKGRIQIYVFLNVLFKLFTNKHLRRMIRLFIKGGKKRGRE